MSGLPFGSGALAFIGGYFVFMLGLGVWARHLRQSESLSDFYLAGKSLGGIVLLLTLYATQYSGNTVMGYPGEAYRLGFAWVMSVGFMMAIVVVLLLIAPRLFALGRRHGFVTPGDWILHRFGSPRLTALANLFLVVAMANYLLAQLMAMGHVVAGLTNHAVPYWVGVVLLTLVMVVYETVGGMRAVAWTDAIQGLMLVVGLGGILIAVAPDLGHLGEISAWVASHEPQKAAVPDAAVCRTWLSTIILVGFSGAVYPQAIQRVFAARNSRTLKRSLSLLVFMPFVTTFVVFLIGIIGLQHFANLRGVAADQVMTLLLSEWAERSVWLYVMTVLVITGILAAIMSTADSVLLSLSSIIAKDFLGTTWLRDASEARLTRAGKLISWFIVLILVAIALVPRITLWGLTELKMEILAQVAPVFVLGIFWRQLQARAAGVGMLVGGCVAVGLTLAGYDKVWGLHSGLLGLLLNFSLCIGLSMHGGSQR